MHAHRESSEFDFGPSKIRISGDGPVLMVDDSEADFEVFASYYEMSEIPNPLIHLPSGLAFMAYLDEVEQGSKAEPALVFLDINMPSMSGHDTLAAMRSREPFRVPVVVMLTGSELDAEREAARAGGARDYIVKPEDGQDYVDIFAALKP